MNQLTIRDYEFLKCFNLEYHDYYIARNENGELNIFNFKPVKLNCWCGIGVSSMEIDDSLFEFISFDDEEPYSMKDLKREYMNKTVDMSGFDSLTDNLEDYVNKQGYTLRDKAEELQRLMCCIKYCYICGVATDSQVKQMNEKFRKQFEKSLYKI